MTPGVADLIRLLELETAAPDVFLGSNPSQRTDKRVFGGQVLAQALIAAAHTAPQGRRCHSLHAYFLRPGDPGTPIVYKVDRSRDGGSFSVRRVVALQNEAQIFVASASFRKTSRVSSIRRRCPRFHRRKICPMARNRPKAPRSSCSGIRGPLNSVR